MTKKEQVAQVLALLDEHYGPTKCYLNHETPWQLLIATILSAQCTDDRVNLGADCHHFKRPMYR